MTANAEWASRYVVLTPFNHQPIIAFFFQYIVDIVSMATGVLDDELIARYLRAKNSDYEHVVSCGPQMQKEGRTLK